MKKGTPVTNHGASAPTESKQKQEKSKAKSGDKSAAASTDPKEKQNKSDAKPDDNSNKKVASNSSLPPKAYYTEGAQGDEHHSYRILDMLIGLFEQAIRKAFPEDSTYPVTVVPGKQTDYQCNSAMPIASVR